MGVWFLFLKKKLNIFLIKYFDPKKLPEILRVFVSFYLISN